MTTFRKRFEMIKRYLIIAAIVMLPVVPAVAQDNSQTAGPKREVTLFNPYKPSLHVVKKRSYLPDMKDTVSVRREFNYAVSSEPFLPAYTVSPIKAASLLSDPLPKLYKSFVNIGFGNYLSPLAEISVTNSRSKKGAIGFYARHFSSNANIKLANGLESYAGYMDNDASLFGKKFFRKSVFESSVDFTQRIRHAYGYNPAIVAYDPVKDDIRMRYNNIGAKASLQSIRLDSVSFVYDFDIFYNYFYYIKNMAQNNFGMEGTMAKSFKGWYVGSGIDFEYYRNSDSLSTSGDAIYSLSPFMRRSTKLWNVKLGFQALMDRTNTPHIYPDIEFGFSIVPSYVSLFAALNGRLERNEPLKLIAENPYMATSQYPDFLPDGILFRVPDTNHEIIVSGGLKGNTGLEGKYLVSASYSIISNMLFYTNLFNYEPVQPAMGNYFMPLYDNVELFNVHAEMSGRFSEKLTYEWMANYNDYNTGYDYAWNKPAWDGKFGLKYNLREKIIAGMDFTAIGKRKNVVNGDSYSFQAGYLPSVFDMSSHFNMNLNAEYRYSKILSFWTRFNNISLKGYEEWAFYPAYRFQFMLGFTYSL
jgi:hypothetical protein